MKRTSKPTIPANAIELLKEFIPHAEISKTSRGNIRIVNPKNYHCTTGWGFQGRKWYVIGMNSYGFWIRRVTYNDNWHTTSSCFPLHYNRNTYRYEFKTFNEAMKYFVGKLTAKKLDF